MPEQETAPPSRSELITNETEVILGMLHGIVEHANRTGTREEKRARVKSLLSWKAISHLDLQAMTELVGKSGRSFKIYLDNPNDLDGDMDQLRTCLHRAGQQYLRKHSDDKIRSGIRRMVEDDVHEMGNEDDDEDEEYEEEEFEDESEEAPEDEQVAAAEPEPEKPAAKPEE